MRFTATSSRYALLPTGKVLRWMYRQFSSQTTYAPVLISGAGPSGLVLSRLLSLYGTLTKQPYTSDEHPAEGRLQLEGVFNKQTNKQKFKVRQPQRAARSKRPNTPSDGSKNNGFHTTNQEEYPSRHPTTETANSAHKTNKQKFKVRQPQRAAKSKRPNAPSDGSKNNGIHTTKQEEYPSRHPTTDTANSSTSKQITSRRLIGVSKSNTIQSTNQAGGPVSPPHMYHPRRPAHQPRLIPKHVAI